MSKRVVGDSLIRLVEKHAPDKIAEVERVLSPFHAIAKGDRPLLKPAEQSDVARIAEAAKGIMSLDTTPQIAFVSESSFSEKPDWIADTTFLKKLTAGARYWSDFNPWRNFWRIRWTSLWESVEASVGSMVEDNWSHINNNHDGLRSSAWEDLFGTFDDIFEDKNWGWNILKKNFSVSSSSNFQIGLFQNIQVSLFLYIGYTMAGDTKADQFRKLAEVQQQGCLVIGTQKGDQNKVLVFSK